MVTILRQSRQSSWLKLQRMGQVGLATGTAALLLSVILAALAGSWSGAAADDGTSCASSSATATATPTPTTTATATATASPSCSASATPTYTDTTSASATATDTSTDTSTATASPTPSVGTSGGYTTSVPVGAPSTGGGIGPGVNGVLAAVGGVVMAAGGGLVLLARWRQRRSVRGV